MSRAGHGAGPNSPIATPFPGRTVIQVMPRIKMIQDSEAEGPLAELYATAKAESPIGVVAEILKMMSLRPDFLAAIQAASRMHFSDGALSRAQHEMIASYVSALNRCRY